MNRLFRSNSSTSSRSSIPPSIPEIPHDDGFLNSEEYSITDVDLKLGDWHIPKVPTSEIYKSSWSLKKAFKTDYHVKTIEQVYGINKEYETCYLLTPATIKAHKKQGHNFLHIGLVQVGVKPLIRKGLNSSILMALRDTRHIKFDDSLLGTIETNLSGGPVHFNCFLDFPVYLHDPHVLKALTLNIKTHGTLMVQGTRQIALIYRVYYKCMRTNFNVQALDKRKPGETTLIQTTDLRSKIQVLSTLKWSDVTFPENWTLENENYPLQIQNPSQNPDLDFVQQLANGTVRLSFDQSRFRSPVNLHFDDPRLRSLTDLHQPHRQPTILLRDRPTSQCSSSRSLAPFPKSKRDLGLKLQGVKTQSQVSTLCYTTKQDSVVDQEDNNSHKTPSPTHTDMEEPRPPVDPYKGLMVIKKEFTPNLVALGREFDLEKNKVKREAYKANHTLEQKKEVLGKWKEFMKEISNNVPFFEYFENHFEWHKKSCVVTKTNWTKEETKEIVRSSHPPLER